MTTRQGYVAAAERNFAAIGLFSHPAPIIAVSYTHLDVYKRQVFLLYILRGMNNVIKEKKAKELETSKK